MSDGLPADWRPAGQRIPSLEPEEWDERVRGILAPTADRVAKLQGDAPPPPRPLHILTTIAHHPALLEAFLPWATALTLGGRLSRRDAEIVSLRASWSCGSDFEWGHHRLYALAAGLSEEEIADIARGPDAARWSVADRALLRAADELHHDRTIGDATWELLAAHFDEAQCIEIVFTVGQYTTLSTLTNALRIPLEPHLPGLPRR